MRFADKAETIYLLDTNIVIYGVRGSSLWQRIKEICDPLMAVPRPAICIVTEGEVLSFAEQQQWSDVKQNQIDFLLNYFTRAAIDSPQVLQAYAKIDAFSRAKGFVWARTIFGLPPSPKSLKRFWSRRTRILNIFILTSYK